ncbi:polysaccharide biosynthesis C-terminal domain-containing protein [Methanothermococcus sp. SCGC AD-155-M21]|nr:polysaccharide biosynthesis C-terminal domain-containing protein [Methanothermococcus sp. SCGC AD-155-M21]
MEDYGLWVQINVSLALIPGLTCLGLPYTLVRYVAGEKDKSKIKETIYSILFVVLVVNAVLSPLFAYLVIRYFGGNELGIVPIFAILLFIQALNMVGWNYLRAMHKIKKYSFLMVIQNLLTIIGIGYAIINGYGIYGAILALFSVSLLMLIILLYEIVSDLGLYIPKFTYLREFLKFGLPTIPSNFSAWIVSSSDRYLIGYFLGIKHVAYYNPAYSLGNLLNFIIGPLGFLLPATLSKLYEGRKIDEVKHYLEYLLKYYLVVAIPAVFGLSILAKPILMILSTQEIAEKSYLVVPFVGASIILFGVYVIVFQILVLKKRTDVAAKIWIVAAALNFFLNIVFIPKFGIIGAAITTLIAYIFTVIVIVRYSLKAFTINLKVSDALKSLTSALVMSLLLQYLTVDGIYGIFLAIVLGAVVYFICLLMLKGFTREEIEYIISLIKR